MRQVFSTKNHCCLSLCKCVKDQAEFKYRRGKSKMEDDVPESKESDDDYEALP